MKYYNFIFLFLFVFYLNYSVYKCQSALGSVAAGSLNDMDFGYVFLGEVKAINYGDPGAARFLIKYSPGSQLVVFAQVRFELPVFLYSPDDKIIIKFPNAYYNFTNSLSGGTVFDPITGFTTWVKLWFFTRSSIYIWLGGQIASDVSNYPGEYRNNVILIVDLY